MTPACGSAEPRPAGRSSGCGAGAAASRSQKTGSARGVRGGVGAGHLPARRVRLRVTGSVSFALKSRDFLSKGSLQEAKGRAALAL